MSLIQQLHQEEKDKNYKKFCDIADEILCGEELIVSPVLMQQIQAKRDFYLDKLFDQRSNLISTSQILKKIKFNDLIVLQKCCPGLTDLIGLKENENNFLSHDQSPSSTIKDNLLDIIITKRKELKVVWDEDFGSDKHDIYYLQVLLDSEFTTTPLRRKATRKPGGDNNNVLLELDNEFMPIFIVCFDTVHSIVNSIKCIPFPSALRGAYHYAELVDSCSEFSGISAVDEFTKKFIEISPDQRIEQISISSENYDMGLVYSNEDFRRWIVNIHGISIKKEILPINKNVLFLPENSYPTISLIVNGFISLCTTETFESAKILIVDDSDYEPLYKLSAKTPEKVTQEKHNNEIVFPCIRNQNKKIDTESVLSVLQSTNHSYLSLHPPRSPISNFQDYSSSPELTSPEILVVVKVTETAAVTEEFLLSLVFQQNVSICRFIFLVNANEEDKLKAKYKTLALKWNWKIKCSFNCDVDYFLLIMRKTSNILFINQYIILQDPNTLRILADNLKKYQSFSSGCMLSHLQSAQKQQLFFNTSAGLYLSLNTYSETGRIQLQAKNIVKSLPPTEIYVVSNHHDLGLYDSKLLLSNQFDQNDLNNIEHFLLQASCQSLINGIHNVCTTKVCATYFQSPTLNMSLSVDVETSKNVVNNLSNLLSKATSISHLLP